MIRDSYTSFFVIMHQYHLASGLWLAKYWYRYVSGVSGRSHEEASNDTLLLYLLTILVVSSNLEEGLQDMEK